jgi:hypothetical protein
LTASTVVQLSQFTSVEQAQQSLEFAAVVGGGVELEGKSASIRLLQAMTWEQIQASKGQPFSSPALDPRP